MTNLRVSLAQTKPVTGDLEGNVQQILREIKKAVRDNADIITFPETAITGYCCGALYEQQDFIVYNKRFLEEVIAPAVPENLVAVIGFVDLKGLKKNGDMNITNSAAIIQGGKILNIYDKTLLANGNHHEDKKYFTPGEKLNLVDIVVNGKKFRVGTPICEDAWKNDHERDIIEEMVDAGAELIVCPNQSYFSYGKQAIRYQLFGGHAKEKQVPVINMNAAGVGDIVKNIMIYDGGSFAFDSKGNLAAQLKRFGQDFQTIELPLKGSVKEPLEQKVQSKYEEIHDALIFEQQELFRVLGMKNAQVHVSGGIDSAIVATLMAEAMGKDHTILITNPTEDNGALLRGYAQDIADKLGIKLYWNSTQEPYEAVVKQHEKAFGQPPTLTGKACIEAVLRTVQGIGAYHTFKSGIVPAGNHTEIVEGWASFHDIGSIGVHSIIGDLTKMEVFQFAAYLNAYHGKEIIPKPLYDGTVKPMAELADAKEDPIDYYVRSGIDAEMIRNKKSINDLVTAYRERTLTEDFFPRDPAGKNIYEHINEEHFTEQVLEAYANARKSVFKAAQAAPIVILSPRS
ncbi:MAG: nitrilase-related carbon-nitrogen hydrolase, partial [Nanoarchaeota archaeon]|nr:nitrilase-related carbon-nitrogen hydrolase [Nanoarchaeota archaeon]